MNFRNMKPDAPWRAQTFSKLGIAKWNEHCSYQGKVLAMPFQPRDRGGLGLTHHFSFHGVLHCMDLGITQHLLGNVVFHLVFTDVLGAGSPQSKFDKVAGWIAEEYQKRKTPSQFSTLEISMFCDP